MISIKKGVKIVDPVVEGRFEEIYGFLNGLLIDS